MTNDLDSKSMLLGDHGARLTKLETDVSEIKDDIKTILAAVNRAKGSWKMLVAIGGITTVVVEGLHELIAWVHHV